MKVNSPLNSDASLRGAAWGIALVAGCTLMLQISFTRLFSIIMWYHMSLVCVSMAMLGLTVGALVVHWRKSEFEPSVAVQSCAKYSLWFAISIVGCLLVCLTTPFVTSRSLMGIFRLTYWNAIVAIPFLFSGICVSAILTSFPKKVGRLYAADLLGASLACILIVFLLNSVDVVTAILWIAVVAALGSIAFAVGNSSSKGMFGRVALIVLLSGLALMNGKTKSIRMQYVLNQSFDGTSLKRELWNAFSYLTVEESKKGPYFWGAGDKANLKADANYIHVQMDTRAATPIVKFDGDWNKMQWLMGDVTSLAHHVRKDGKVMVIGFGGGRDVLTALIESRGTREVVGVDVNPNMGKLVTELESDYIGNISRLPNVSLHVDEARSFVTRSKDRYQVITIPLVDTSAASAAGAYALTENSLYTLDAFTLFLQRLTEDGVLSVTRCWWGGSWGETHRLLQMSADALRAIGVQDPRQHMYMVRGRELVTILTSRRPFSPQDLSQLKLASDKAGFEVLLTPVEATNSSLLIAFGNEAKRPSASVVDLSSPTDDRPFFFHGIPLSRVISRVKPQDLGVARFDFDAMVILFVLIVLVTGLAFCVIGVPFFQEFRRKAVVLSSSDWMGLVYFLSIGFGFMFFESAQIQRLNIFLGYPIYSITVVLFTLLLASAFGAYLIQSLLARYSERNLIPLASLCLLVVMSVTGILMPKITVAFGHFDTPTRIIISSLLLIPSGILMGAFFPIGVHLLTRMMTSNVSLAWFWAINGIASTCAGVYSVGLSVSYGFNFVFWLGLSCYIVASLMSLRLVRGKFTLPVLQDALT
jgi:hypothetical protein